MRLLQLLKHTKNPFFVTLYSTRRSSARDMFKDGRRRRTIRGFQRATSAARPQTHSHTQPSHTCANSPSDFLQHTFPVGSHTAESVLQGVGCWALGQCVPKCNASALWDWHADNTHRHTHRHECYMQIHVQWSKKVLAEIYYLQASEDTCIIPANPVSYKLHSYTTNLQKPIRFVRNIIPH